MDLMAVRSFLRVQATLLLFFLGTQSHFGQKPHTAASIDIILGTKLFTNNLYGQFKTPQNTDLSLPVNMVGIGLTGTSALARKGLLSHHFSYCQVISDMITINDSVQYQISGNVFSVALGTNLLTGSRSVDLLWAAGFNLGRLKATSDPAAWKNPFFSPKLTLQPRILMWKFALSVRAEYEFDISKRQWNKIGEGSGPARLDDFDQSGTSLFVMLGWLL